MRRTRRRRSGTMLHSYWRIGTTSWRIAETGSGGSLAASLSASAAGSRVLASALVGASNDQLRQLLLVADAAWQDASSAKQRVRLLTEQVASRSQCPWAIGVGEVEVREGSSRYLSRCMRCPDGDVHIQRLPAIVNDPGPRAADHHHLGSTTPPSYAHPKNCNTVK